MNIEKQRKSEVQSLVFDKKKFTEVQAKKWATDNDFKATKVDEKPDTFRLRQKNPDQFDDFRTIQLKPGVNAVLGIKKELICKENEPEGGMHGHLIDRLEKRLEEGGYHSHIFRLSNGEFIATLRDGSHEHGMPEDSADDSLSGKSAHQHLIIADDGEMMVTDKDGDHGHQLQVTHTGLDGLHIHALRMKDGTVVKSLTPGEFWELLGRPDTVHSHILKELKVFDGFTPPKPGKTGMRVLKSIEGLIDFARNRFPLAIEPAFDGERIIIHKQGKDVRMFLNGTSTKDVSAEHKEIKKILSNLDGDFIIDSVHDEGVFHLLDIPFHNTDIHKETFKERREVLEEFVEGVQMQTVPIRFANSEAEIEPLMNEMMSIEGAVGVLAKNSEAEYELAGGLTSETALLPIDKEIQEDVVLALAAIGYEITLKEEEEDIKIPIMKSNDEKQLVYGIVWEPEFVDGHNEVISAEEIEKTAHKYLVNSRIVGKRHTDVVNAEVVESYIAPVDFEFGGQRVKAGSWIIVAHITDPVEWGKVKSGFYTGFSPGGFGLKEVE